MTPTVTVSPSSATLITGSKQQFSASVTPPQQLNNSFVWSCSIGVIDQTGLYTPPDSPQTVTVKATRAGHPGQVGIVSVTVIAQPIPPTPPGPPTPSFRTDLTIEQLPALPDMGGALGKNTVVTDPVFGARIIRATDSSSGAGNGASMQTTDGPSSYNVWGEDDTILIFKNTNGVAFPHQFDGKKITQLDAPKVTGSYAWSKVKSGVLYSMALGTTVVMRQTYALIKGVWTFDNSEKYCDFANELPAGFKANWQSGLEVSEGDAVISAAFSTGAQDTGFSLCLYKDGAGYRSINTQTREIKGDWGEVGTANLQNTDMTSFLLHETTQSPNPRYTMLSPVTTSSVFIWDNATLNLTLDGLSGHQCLGYSHKYSGGAGGGQQTEIAYSNPLVRRNVIPKAMLPAQQTPAQNYVGDAHPGFGRIDPNDQSVMWITNGPPLPDPFTSCWEGELRGVDIATGKVYRACHTRHTGLAKSFIGVNAILSASRSGKYVAFASDWGGTLGEGRADVFIAVVG